MSYFDLAGTWVAPILSGHQWACVELQCRHATKVGSMPMPKIEVIRARPPATIGDRDRAAFISYGSPRN
jgi:hypothetical protein